MFPAHAGMNRTYGPLISRPQNVPRTRGDEPEYGTTFFDTVLNPPVLSALTQLIDGLASSVQEEDWRPLYRGVRRSAGVVRAIERQTHRNSREYLAHRLNWMLYKVGGKKADGKYHRAYTPRLGNEKTAAMLLKRYREKWSMADLRQDFLKIRQEREARKGR